MSETKKITEAELWKLRAYMSEQKSLMSELTIMQMKIDDFSKEIEKLRKELLEKYECSDFAPDGTLLFEEDKE